MNRQQIEALTKKFNSLSARRVIFEELIGYNILRTQDNRFYFTDSFRGLLEVNYLKFKNTGKALKFSLNEFLHSTDEELMFEYWFILATTYLKEAIDLDKDSIL